MPSYLVGAGGRLFSIPADDPRQAIALMRTWIMLRALEKENPVISMCLVDAHREGTLNYIVFNENRSELLAGELRGQFQQPVTRELADAMRHLIPDEAYYRNCRTLSLTSLGFGQGEADALIQSLNRRLYSS